MPTSHNVNSPSFHFRQFSLQHHRSSMKVGTDAILIGAWAGQGIANANRILDIGTGCGIIALMLAQRFSEATIDAIDSDKPSVAEAKINFKNSGWATRLHGHLIELQNYQPANNYDLIVSNPPWFETGPNSPITARKNARHRSSLPPQILARQCAAWSHQQSRTAIIVPYESAHEFQTAFADCHLFCEARCDIRPTPDKPPKRSLLQFSFNRSTLRQNTISIELSRHHYSPQYTALAADFLLRMSPSISASSPTTDAFD